MISSVYVIDEQSIQHFVIKHGENRRFYTFTKSKILSITNGQVVMTRVRKLNLHKQHSGTKVVRQLGSARGHLPPA